MLKKLQKHKKALLLSAAFFIPFFLLGLIYAIFGISPFGDESLLIMDLNGQNVDFYAYIRGILTDGNSPVYSFSKGIGGNMLSLIGFYGALPLTFISAVFPASMMPEAIFFINCIIVGLCGLCMYVFLYEQKKTEDFSILIFSTAYAVMSYSILYSMELQWLYGAMFLPLVALGVDRIIQSGKWGTFVASYTALLLCNIYTGYMVTLFSGIYFLWRLISVPKCQDGVKKFVTYVLSGILSFALSAAFTVPQYVATMAGRADQATRTVDQPFTIALNKIFSKFYIGQYDSITNNSDQTGGTVAIFCTMLILGLLVYYFINKNITLREKLCSGAVFVILALSVVFVRFDAAWHIFEIPNWFPFRWAFIISFFMVMLAYRAWSEPETKGRRVILTFIGLLWVMYVNFTIFNDRILNKQLALLSIASLGAYAFLFYMMQKHKKAACVILMLCVCFEVTLNGVVLVKGLDRQFGYKNRTDYEITQVVKDMADRIHEHDDAPFYRIEKTDLRSDNDALNAGYAGMTHYSSSFDKLYKDLNYKLGLIQEWYACRYSGATPVIDSVFGVKYIMSRYMPADSPSYSRVIEGDVYDVYKNADALPLGFMIKSDGQAPSYTQNDFLENQNIFYKAITGDRAFDKISAQNTDNHTYRFTITRSMPVYMSLTTKLSDNITVERNGNKIRLRDGAETKCKILGTFRPGDEIVVKLPQAQNGVSFAYLEESVLEKNAEKLTRTGFNINKFDDTYIRGTIDAESSGNFMFTIPYDKGWRVYVDGKRVETKLLLNTFIGIDIEKGEHEIVMKYKAPGMTAGFCMSLAAAAVLFAIYYKKKKQA